MKSEPKKFEINRVFIVYKRSVYQKYVLERGHPKMQELLDRNDLSTRSVKKAHDTHAQTLEQIIQVVDSHHIKYDLETRHHIKSLKGYDLIIAVGGDGTFLRTSHHVKNQYIIGVNSAPEFSVGATCSVTHKHFAKKFEQILRGNFEIVKLSRIAATLNGTILPTLAVNDILFTNLSPAATSRYFMQLGKKREEQKSSGVWISTALGSTAAVQAAGGKPMTRDDKRLQFITREPYQGTYHPYNLIQGFVEPKQKLKIISKMMESRVYMDGPMNFFNLHYGDVIEFSTSPKTLNVIK